MSLKTRVKAEAVQKVNAMNETERQPGISLSLARVYLNATDPKLATRTWQDVMVDIAAKKTDETRRRWEVAVKDKNFDCIRRLTICFTRNKLKSRGTSVTYGLVSATQHPNFVHQDLSASEGIVMKANKPNSASDPAHGTLELEPLRSRRVRCQARLGSAYKT